MQDNFLLKHVVGKPSNYFLENDCHHNHQWKLRLVHMAHGLSYLFQKSGCGVESENPFCISMPNHAHMELWCLRTLNQNSMICLFWRKKEIRPCQCLIGMTQWVATTGRLNTWCVTSSWIVFCVTTGEPDQLATHFVVVSITLITNGMLMDPVTLFWMRISNLMLHFNLVDFWMLS